MGFSIVVPEGVFGGWRWELGPLVILFAYHSLQCDQRWFAVVAGYRRLGYRTHGDAQPNNSTYRDGGWWWPWQAHRTFSGRGW